MRSAWRLPLVLLAVSASAEAFNPQLRADQQAVGQACATDAAVAHCGGLAPGRGLLRCMKAFHHANPGFRVSPACRAARRQLHRDRIASRYPAY